MDDADFQRRIQRYGWDKAVSYYDNSWQKQLEPAQALLLRMADLRPGEQVLDIASGTGLVTFPAAAGVGATGSVKGVDLSDRMVEAARDIASRRSVTNVTFGQSDAEQLTEADGSFDVALCALGLMYVPDPAASLTEMHRVLKPGGRAVAAVWGQRDRCGWASIFPIVESRVQSDVCPLFFRLGTKEILAQTFQHTGFDRVASERISTTLHYTSPEEACLAVFEGGPVALANARFNATTRREASEEYLSSIESYRAGSGYAIPGEFVVVSGLKV